MRASHDQARHPAGKRHSAEIGRTSDSGFTEAYRTSPPTAIASDGVDAEIEPWLFDPAPFLISDCVIAPAPGQ